MPHHDCSGCRCSSVKCALRPAAPPSPASLRHGQHMSLLPTTGTTRIRPRMTRTLSNGTEDRGLPVDAVTRSDLCHVAAIDVPWHP